MLDVARRAGVSGATASCVLHGTRSNMRVGANARQRVEMAARELNYTPNALARAFRRQRTNIIGLYLGDWLINTHHAFLAEVVSGLQLGCNEYRKDLLIHGTFRGVSVEDVYGEIINGKVDGLIMFAKDEDPLVKMLSESSLPVVAVADAAIGLPSVVADDTGGSVLLADYIASKGHRCVLYKKPSTTQSSVLRREQAFYSEAAKHGILVLAAELTGASGYRGLTPWDAELITRASGSEAKPSVIVCSNDEIAFDVINSCAAYGLEVPGNLAVVGFDGIDTMRLGNALTTIQAPWSDVAQTAVRMIMHSLDGGDVPRETVLPVTLLPGKTC
jgi:DNA-binding LacI/PurR family transcriptional regulator